MPNPRYQMIDNHNGLFTVEHLASDGTLTEDTADVLRQWEAINSCLGRAAKLSLLLDGHPVDAFIINMLGQYSTYTVAVGKRAPA